jgi:hypothetical protein
MVRGVRLYWAGGWGPKAALTVSLLAGGISLLSAGFVPTTHFVAVAQSQPIRHHYDGHGNTGQHDHGNYNTGDHDGGNYNTGDYDGGNYNTGDYDGGNYNTGDYDG